MPSRHVSFVWFLYTRGLCLFSLHRNSKIVLFFWVWNFDSSTKLLGHHLFWGVTPVAQTSELLLTPRRSHDPTCDPGKEHVTSHDQQPHTQSLGRVNLLNATHPLKVTRPGVGTINKGARNQPSYKTKGQWGNAPTDRGNPKGRAPIEDAPTRLRVTNLSYGQNGHLSALCKPPLKYAQTTLY